MEKSTGNDDSAETLPDRGSTVHWEIRMPEAEAAFRTPSTDHVGCSAASETP